MVVFSTTWSERCWIESVHYWIAVLIFKMNINYIVTTINYYYFILKCVHELFYVQ